MPLFVVRTCSVTRASIFYHALNLMEVRGLVYAIALARVRALRRPPLLTSLRVSQRGTASSSVSFSRVSRSFSASACTPPYPFRSALRRTNYQLMFQQF